MSGPACRPGQGGGTLFATIDGEATSANRDLFLEVHNAQSLIDQCAGLTSHLSESWTATFPTPVEALDLLLDLESLVDSQAVTLHWPKGRSLRVILAGTVEEKILELHATKRDLAESLLEGTDRSGKLTTDELLQLIKP